MCQTVRHEPGAGDGSAAGEDGDIVGIKEASGNISQMAAVLNAVREDFVVLAGMTR